jgi:hypothetical protein
VPPAAQPPGRGRGLAAAGRSPKNLNLKNLCTNNQKMASVGALSFPESSSAEPNNIDQTLFVLHSPKI